jgi:ribosomal protein L7/L12
MKVTDPRPMDPAVVAEVAAMLQAGRDHDEVIARMRALGLHKIECMKIFRDYGGVTLGSAKDIVHLSPAWADRYKYDEAFHEAAEQALDMMIAEDKLTAA